MFPRKAPPPRLERFLSVHANWDYGIGRLTWHNPPPLMEGPRAAGYASEGVPITVLERPQLTFDGPSDDLTDVYEPGGGIASLFSMRLFELVETLDPGSTDTIPAMIRTKDAIVPYRFAMPVRSLYAVDVDHTDILVEDENYAGEWLRSVKFPSGSAFRDDLPAGDYSFAERYLPFWYWSRELIDAFRAAGMRGIYTRTHATENDRIVDEV